MKDEQFNLLVDLINSVQNNLHEEIQSVRTELKSEIQSVRSELKGEIQDVRTELAETKEELKDDIRKLSIRMNKLEDAVRENTIINRKQHAFLIDLIQGQNKVVV